MLHAEITRIEEINPAMFDALDQARQADTLDSALNVLQARFDYSTRLYSFKMGRGVLNVHTMNRKQRVAFICEAPAK